MRPDTPQWPEPPTYQTTWSPRSGETVLAVVLGVVLGGLALVTDDVAGRFLGAVAGVGLLAVAAADLVLRPRLAADPDGLAVRTTARRVRLAWSEVDAIRVDERQRFGLRQRTLEIDSGDDLYLFGRRTLGSDPLDVAETLTRLRR